MIFGAITNSWKNHLDDCDLTDLIRTAGDKGARYIELREKCLGDAEKGQDDDWRPVIPVLQKVVNAFPELSFNLAIDLPFLTRRIGSSGEKFQAALNAAESLSQEKPHLRLVDRTRFEKAWVSEDQIPEEVVIEVTDLAREAAGRRIILSIENAGQPISTIAKIVRMARSRLSAEEGSYLGICPDPINQLLRHPATDPLKDLEELPLDMMKIVHFKQTLNGNPHPRVDIGDLDCSRQLKILEAKGYAGPVVMEIPPHEQVFDNLSASFSFLRAASGKA